MVEKALQYIEENQTRFLQELQEFLRFPSVSTQSARKNDLLACAHWLCDHLANIGLESRLVEGAGHPIVWARAPGRSSKRIIIYGTLNKSDES